MTKEINTLEEMLNRIGESSDDEGRVTLGSIVESVGGRSFGPLLLLIGVIMTSPLSGMPGIPTTMGILVVLIAGQLLFGKDHFWLPRWVLKRSLEQQKICKAIDWLRPPARFVDRWLRPRLPAFVKGWRIHLISFLCVAIGAVMPIMEVVPFSAHAAGLALTAFGLALIARDGLLALISFLVIGLSFAVFAYNMI
ncbi:exopolysaccharide biosynthesis protein [Citrifermentans bremense]|uniref:exopolysaccharide biosynthesis protein n=1 Tax=Citrifermentans bremense TaxID=60035 RepID=UPI000427D7A7|nr:exopolysaccharide biosynthesis protein [Citrifermentans bremense]